MRPGLGAQRLEAGDILLLPHGDSHLVRSAAAGNAGRIASDVRTRDWTLDEMASVAIASRATLVRAFQKRAEIAPMTFLSDLRLAVARKRLAGTSDPIAKIASEVGYAS